MKKKKEKRAKCDFFFFFLPFSKYFLLVGKQTRLEENDGSKGLGFMGRNERFSRESCRLFRIDTHTAERERSGFWVRSHAPHSCVRSMCIV